jgi:hypothetical protein
MQQNGSFRELLEKTEEKKAKTKKYLLSATASTCTIRKSGNQQNQI